jgi:hypothetical protein
MYICNINLKNHWYNYVNKLKRSIYKTSRDKYILFIYFDVQITQFNLIDIV